MKRRAITNENKKTLAGPLHLAPSSSIIVMEIPAYVKTKAICHMNDKLLLL